MGSEALRYRPTLDQGTIDNRLERLLVPGPLADHDLERRAARLGERFRTYASCAPHGLWAPGLVLTRKMREYADFYLPQAEIRRAFDRLFSIALTYRPFLPASVLHTSATWLDALHRLHALVREANPERLLRRLLCDDAYRHRFLFALFLPPRYGGTFDRYPAQSAFLREWLATHRPAGAVRCLDAACGSGEGCYELAMLLRTAGRATNGCAVHGATVEPLELFAAAHGWFPHDPARQAAYRRRIAPLVADGTAGMITLYREDLVDEGDDMASTYDVIVCNGLLGGPLLNERAKLTQTIGRLCARLRPGGILLTANRFHGGWQGAMPAELGTMLEGHGLTLVACGEGVAGINGTGDRGAPRHAPALRTG